ncbi:hypothetical protein GLAREA_08063 [Glarea lozoyensis ATCC 20868]|uniref:Alcohol acetyltransferase n=1 Tax=Glarea lozoyensis (strain ATCC 20868 / MF5171) TaxID=1116229 RepID=S3DC27_GLAL2|nr:uncharacterized protein GLAREA_08063 [Glarea lozoyensis ATCC 20868]EPE24213.1 hypothetical protein GLAREA_08063 [Glarea lozoyensis ATCC 20868]
MARPVGLLEQMSTARHDLGYYHSVGATARYSTPTSTSNLRRQIQAALTKVILQYPALCHGIINEGALKPSFKLVESIDLDRCIEWITVTSDRESKLAETLEQAHSTRFSDIEVHPPWKLLIITPETKPSTFDAAFIFHHALGDGMSGKLFHGSFASALNTPSSSPPELLVPIPSSTKLPPPIEALIPFTVSYRYLLLQIWESIRPAWFFPSLQPWTSTPISATNLARGESRMTFFALPADLMKVVLSECRENGTTLTGLLHALALLSFTNHVPQGSSFTSTTPYSLRHLTGTKDDMVVQVSALSTTYPTSLVTSLRASSNLTEEIWSLARDFKKNMAVELARAPRDVVLGLLPYISDMHEFFRSKIGKGRESTFEVSNVGVLAPPASGDWNVERVLFSQSGMGTGALVGINVASVVGGELVVSLTWLEGDVDSALVERVRDDLRYGLRCVGEGRDVVRER